MKDALRPNVIEHIKALGFRVYMREPEDTFAYVESDKGICYIQTETLSNELGIYSVHHPTQGCGTGFKLTVNPPQSGKPFYPTAKELNTAISTMKPNWCYSNIKITKYKNMEEYRQRGAFERAFKPV